MSSKTYLSGFGFPGGTSLYNGPFVTRDAEGEEQVREVARADLRRHGGYRHKSDEPGGDAYWREVEEEEIEAVVAECYIHILSFRGHPLNEP